MAVTVIDSNNLEAVLSDAQKVLTPGAPAPEPAKPKTDAKPAQDASATAQKPAESTGGDGADHAADPDDVEGEDGLTPRQKRELSQKMLKAIGKKHRELREAEEFAAAQYSERVLAERRAQAAEAELATRGKQETAQTEVQAEAKEPKREDFATDKEYLDAMIAFGVEKQLQKRAQDEAKKAFEQQRVEIEAKAKERVAKAVELVADFREKVIERAKDIELPMPVMAYMERSELLAELAYHFATHPEVTKALNKLPTDEQLVTIGKIESTLSPFGSSDSKTKTDGATPSKQAATSSTTDGKQPAKGEAPSDETGSTPSKARSTAPVLTPLNGTEGSAVQLDPRDMNIRETINDWTRKNGVRLDRRKRH